MKTTQKTGESTYEPFEYVLIGTGILGVLVAVWSFLVLYKQFFGHQPY